MSKELTKTEFLQLRCNEIQKEIDALKASSVKGART
jgi:hypothetical protein